MRASTVLRAGQSPRWQQTDRGLEPVDFSWCAAKPPTEAVQSLPRLAQVTPDGTDIRVTAWVKNGQRARLIISLRDKSPM